MGLSKIEEGEMATQKSITRYVPSPEWGIAWNRCVHALHHLICQGAPVEWIQAHLRVLGQIPVFDYN